MSKQNGIQTKTDKKDKRYTLTREFTGHKTKRIVVRFCDEHVGSGETMEQAKLVQEKHQRARSKELSNTLAQALMPK